MVLSALLEKTAIKITGYSASPKHQGKGSIDKGFDGNENVGRGDCYVSDPEKNGFARIDIDQSAVDRIELLNRNEYS